MSIMIKPCNIVYCVINLFMISLVFLAKADHDNDENFKGSLKAHFIFGDSLVDAGNNNYFFTLSKGNKRPNGIDYKPSGGNPTGRYTNGRTAVDIIGEELGEPNHAVPFLAPSSKGKAILFGVNYGSGGSGILDASGKIFINTLEMDIQVYHFSITRQQLNELLGPSKAKDYVMKKSIFTVSIGSVDFLGNYLLPGVSIAARILESPDDFIEDMIEHLRDQLTRLYKLDGRKFLVVNVGPIGCIPYQKKINPQINQDQCVKFPNELAIKYNKRLKHLLDDLNHGLEGSTFVYGNGYDVAMDIITNYDKFGFTTASEPCYKENVVELERTITSSLCSDRSTHVFWDTFHLTEAANLMVAKRFLDGDTRYISPINLRQLRDL